MSYEDICRLCQLVLAEGRPIGTGGELIELTEGWPVGAGCGLLCFQMLGQVWVLLICPLALISY